MDYRKGRKEKTLCPLRLNPLLQLPSHFDHIGLNLGF